MHQAVMERTRGLEAEVAQGTAAMRVVPLLGPSQAEPPYRLLERDVLEKVRVTEVSEGGSVPQLLVTNDLDERVYLMDGQELVGAKQNRILNTDVLAPPRSQVRIPVSCVEQGRWSYKSAAFTPGQSVRFATRRRKSQTVHESLRHSGVHDADQHQVWEEVAESLHALEVDSPTSALSDAYAARRSELETLRQSLKLPEGAVGLAIYSGGKLQGVDIFDRHTTLAYFWQSLIDSYGLDHLGQRIEVAEPEPDLPADLAGVLQTAGESEWETFPSPGEGEDLRLRHEAYSGSALLWCGRNVIHLQLFPKPPATRPREAQERRPRMHLRYVARRSTHE